MPLGVLCLPGTRVASPPDPPAFLPAEGLWVGRGSGPPNLPTHPLPLTVPSVSLSCPLSLPGAVSMPELQDVLCPPGPFPAVDVGQHASSPLCQFPR